MEKSASKHLAIFAHPDLEKSHFSSLLLKEFQARKTEVLLIAEQVSHPNWSKNLYHHRQFLLEFSHFTLIFPIHWYNIPSMLQKWLEDTFVSGFAFGDRFAFEGRTIKVVASAGGKREDYTNQGKHRTTLGRLLSPIDLTLAQLKFIRTEPVYVYSAYACGPAEIKDIFLKKVLDHG